MRKIQIIKSVAAPLLLPNIDTDIISPMKRILYNINELDKYTFEPLRFLDGDGDKGELNPDFPLNMPAYRGAKIMIVGENFGCGSSRETAPEGMASMGIECIIGSSFGGIFFKNCFQQGILPIMLPLETVHSMAEQTLKGEFVVNLYEQTITTPSGEVVRFDVDPLRRESLLEGLDDVGRTLKKVKAIDQFKAKDKLARPWIYCSTK
ncbi:MAG: 3-isopropylmalate dehydratase small subunit [Bacillota bacterium]|nr:3-isopropylmalate dehydratase small subunit [Bacillota bacterium]